MGDVDRRLREVHVLPFQSQDFSLSHSRLQSYDNDRAEVTASSDENLEEPSLFFIG
jgi:hypothetical protein